jgi:fibro-slime domain-containing protein
VIRKALAAGLLVCLVLPSCGRTGLLTSQPCGQEGATEPCENGCGYGVLTCTNGYFGACVVPDATRECANACGTGTETCSDGAWGSCTVARAERSCQGVCGTGAQACSDGAWGDCDVPVAVRDCSSVCGSGHESCIDGSWQPCDAPLPLPPILHTVIRDFTPSTNPDFEFDLMGTIGDDPYIVGPLLGADDTPMYTGDPRIHTTTATTFYEWYHDTPESIRIDDVELELQSSTDKPGFFVYDNPQFFPIDGRGFGNYENYGHNYHFTLATELTFRYVGGEVFSFSGDDDIWVFINRHLAINLGGLHEQEGSSVTLDEHTTDFELALGQVYPIHIFFAERHTFGSEFMLETSVADPSSCP